MMTSHADYSSDKPRPIMTVNSALSLSAEQLLRCESIAQGINIRIHGEPTLSTGNSVQEKEGPPNTSRLSNNLADRLERLGNLLQSIEESF